MNSVTMTASAKNSTNKYSCDHTGYCANGASCVEVVKGLKICNCASGFEGPRCADLVVKFVGQEKNEENEWTSSIAIWIAVGCLVAIFVIAVLYMVYKTCTTKDNSRIWKKWKICSHSSRSTLESFTSAKREKHQNKFWGIDQLFTNKNKATEATDCESGHVAHDKSWDTTSSNLRATSMPSLNSCNISDRQVSNNINDIKISVINTEESSETIPPKPNTCSTMNEGSMESTQGYINKALDVSI